MRWRLYYADGSTFSDRDGEPEEAPVAGVMCVAQEAANPQGFQLLYGTSNLDGYWFYRDESWFCCDQLGFWDNLLMFPNPKIMVFGRSMPRDADFWAIIERAGREGVG